MFSSPTMKAQNLAWEEQTQMWNSGYNFVDRLDKEVILLRIALSLLIKKHPFSLKIKFKPFFSLNQETVLFCFLICQDLTDKS